MPQPFYPPQSRASKLIDARRGPFRRLAREVLALYGIEVPPDVEVGPGLRIMHRGFGIVIHRSTTIGANVMIFPGVTLGRADPWLHGSQSAGMERIVVQDDAVLCTGAKVLCKTGVLTVAEGTVVGANAVLTESTQPYEIWAGAPARCVGVRAPATGPVTG